MSKTLIQSRKFILMAGIFLASLLSLTEALANTTKVPGLKISGLGNYRGQFLSVYYTYGKRPSLSVGTSDFDLKHVIQKRTISITADSVSVPEVELNLIGLWPLKPNFIGFIIHPQATVTFINADNSLPKNEDPDNSQRISRLDSLTFEELRLLVNAETKNGVVPTAISYILR